MAVHVKDEPRLWRRLQHKNNLMPWLSLDSLFLQTALVRGPQNIRRVLLPVSVLTGDGLQILLRHTDLAQAGGQPEFPEERRYPLRRLSAKRLRESVPALGVYLFL